MSTIKTIMLQGEAQLAKISLTNHIGRISVGIEALFDPVTHQRYICRYINTDDKNRSVWALAPVALYNLRKILAGKWSVNTCFVDDTTNFIKNDFVGSQTFKLILCNTSDTHKILEHYAHTAVFLDRLENNVIWTLDKTSRREYISLLDNESEYHGHFPEYRDFSINPVERQTIWIAIKVSN